MSDLAKQIKDHIGYTTERPPKCSNCKHSREVDGVVDRSWETKCDIAANVIILSVDPDGRCKKHEPK